MNTNRVKGEDHYQCRKVKAERDKLRAELEECIRAWALTTSELAKERERVRERDAAIITTLTELRSMGIWTDKLVGVSMRSLLERLIALSAGEGGKRDYYSKDWRDEMTQDQGCTKEQTND